jgi:hypothetical protein
MLEGSGFELSVLPQKESPFRGATTRVLATLEAVVSFCRMTKIAAPMTGDRGFESTSLQRRVCKPSVPLETGEAGLTIANWHGNRAARSTRLYSTGRVGRDHAGDRRSCGPVNG